MKLFKLFIILVGFVVLALHDIRLGLENNKLKVANTSLYNGADSVLQENQALKSQIEGYQDWMRKIEQGVSRLCPEALKGQPHAPQLRAPQNAPAKPQEKEIELPMIEIHSTPTPINQDYKINGAMPRI
jgi:hypothetical protein